MGPTSKFIRRVCGLIVVAAFLATTPAFAAIKYLKKFNSDTGRGDWVVDVTGSGLLTDAPSDGNTYGRKNGTWAVPTGGAHDAVTLAASATPILGLSTQELSFDVQNANKVLAGPTTGADAAPTFRLLVAGDIPDISATYQPKDADLTTYAGITPTANAQTLLGETFAQMQASLSIDDLITLSGVAEGAANLGTFTGTTIPDNQTIKQGLQALETAVELKAPTNNATMTGTFGVANNTNIAGNKHKWVISVKNGSSAITTPYIIPIGFTDAAITVTQVKANTSSASYEIAGDLKYADARIGLANATVVNDFDTTSGVRTDTSITSASIASGKFVYILFDAAPNASDTDDIIEVEWDYDA